MRYRGLFRRSPRFGLPALIAPGHRFDQTNGVIVEREQTAAELSSARWSDHEPPPTILQWGWRVVDPTRSATGTATATRGRRSAGASPAGAAR